MRRTRLLSTLLFCSMLAGALFVGCEEQAIPGSEKVDKKPASKKEAPKPGAKKPTAVASSPKSSPKCVGPIAQTPERTFTLKGRIWEQKGSTLTLKTADRDDEFIIGHLTDVKDFTPENAANINVALAWFKKNSVDAIAISGDLGESKDSIQRVVEHVAKSNVPVMALIGNRECRDDFNQALAAAQKKFKHVINLNHVRVINTDDASIVSMPGYYNKSYIHCESGCEYFPADAQALAEIAKTAVEPRVLISHGPPKQSGEKAIDRIHEEVNVGDPALTAVMKGGLFPFGLFGNIQEAGGYATDLSGRTRIAPKAFAKALYLNSGPIDSVRWEMLDGSDSVGMAGVLKIKGKQASHEIYRIKPGEAKVSP